MTKPAITRVTKSDLECALADIGEKCGQDTLALIKGTYFELHAEIDVLEQRIGKLESELRVYKLEADEAEPSSIYQAAQDEEANEGKG